MTKSLGLLIVILSIGCGGSPDSARQNPPATATERAAAGAVAAGQGTTATGLTVLVPEALARQETTGPGFAVAETHYSVTQRDEQVTLSLTGGLVSREESSIVATPGTPADMLRGVPVYVTENDGIKTATWIENGTAYALDIECASEKDERCTSSDYIKNVVKGLVRKVPR